MQIKEDKDHPLYQKEKSRPAAPVEVAKDAKRARTPRADLPLLTYALMAVNGCFFLAGFLMPELEWELFLRGALIPQLVAGQGEVYRLFTAMFLHGSLGHVFFNVYALYIVGRSVEPIFGRIRFLLIYLLGGLTGSALSLALGGLDGASVGASGAVFAIFRRPSCAFISTQRRIRECSGSIASHGISHRDKSGDWIRARLAHRQLGTYRRYVWRRAAGLAYRSATCPSVDADRQHSRFCPHGWQSAAIALARAGDLHRRSNRYRRPRHQPSRHVVDPARSGAGRFAGRFLCFLA